MREPEFRSLLDDLFADDGTERFRETARSLMLGAVRRKRRVRRIQSVALALVILGLIPLAWRLTEPAAPISVPGVSARLPYASVTTASFPLASVVQTQPGCCPITTTRAEGYARIESLDSGRFVRQLDDEQLLGFFAGRSVGLVRLGSGRAKLVFAGEASRDVIQMP